MENSKSIYIIHAKDADQHLGNLKKILEDLKNENRIDSYTALESNAVKENSFQDIGPGDMVILLLTYDLENDKPAIERMLFDLSKKQPDCKIAEIIVDNIPYEPKFIAFPPDLEPIRSRENMDAVWEEIKDKLRNFFPIPEEPSAPSSTFKKYIPYILGILVLILLVILFWPNNSDDTGEKEEFSVMDVAAFVDGSTNHSGTCPHQFKFVSEITVNGPGEVKYKWLRSDNANAPEKSIIFEEAGTKEVETSWNLGADGESYENFWQKIQIISPNELESNEATFTLNCSETELANEDCLNFNYRNVRAIPDGDGYLVTDDRSRMMIFDTQEKAEMAVDIIKHYEMTAHCFAIRPQAGLRYFKVGNGLPSGNFSGEDCIRINNPENLQVRRNSSNSFSILDGNHIPFSAKSAEEARRIVEIVEHYKPKYTCYVERPDPGMVYLRK